MTLVATSAPPALQPGQPVGDALRQIASHILTEAHDILADSGKDKALAVHEIRKALKRWRAMLRMLAPSLGQESRALRDDAHNLAHKLTPARDAQTALDAFNDMVESASARSLPLSNTSRASIRARLEALRKRGERRLWNEESRQNISDYVTAASYRVSRWPLDAVAFGDIAGRLSATYRRARGAIPQDWAQAGAHDLHELRRRVIEHRYQMELVEPAWPRLGRIWVDEAQRLRNRLGKYQDLAVLAAMMAPHRPLAHWRSRLAPTIAVQQAGHCKAAARVAARLFAEPPKAFRRRLQALWQGQGGD